jgi:SRSO17 transposase
MASATSRRRWDAPAGAGYVLGVKSNAQFHSWGKPRTVAGTAKEIADGLLGSAWRRASAGAETNGERLHDWAYLMRYIRASS